MLGSAREALSAADNPMVVWSNVLKSHGDPPISAACRHLNNPARLDVR